MSSSSRIEHKIAINDIQHTCPICIETIDEELFFTPCFHAFHNSCLSTWLATSSKCPICKTDIMYNKKNAIWELIDYPFRYQLPRSPIQQRRLYDRSMTDLLHLNVELPRDNGFTPPPIERIANKLNARR